MKDFYFIAGLGLGALVGMAVMYKSKMAKQVAQKCEQGLNEAANEVKKTIAPKNDKKPAQKKEK